MSRDRFAPAIREAADRYGLRPELLDAVVEAESNYNPGAVSPVGAIGLMQLMPATARQLGVDPKDPLQNIEGGARYLSDLLRRFGSEEMALAAYNWGMGNVRKRGLAAAPQETQDYVGKVLEQAGPPSASWAPGASEETLPPPLPAQVPPTIPQAPTQAAPNMLAGLPATVWTAPLLIALALRKRGML